MPSASQIKRIKSKLPSGKEPPEGFDDFLSAGLPVAIRWSSLKDQGFTKAAERELVPFVHIADGALVAFWFSVEPAAVVYVDAHGEAPTVVAKDFPNFLRSLSASKTGIPDLDDDCSGATVEGYASRPVKSGIAALQRQLNNWVQTNSSLQDPNESQDGEQVRKRIHSIAKQMIREGKCKVYTIRSSWRMHYRIQRIRNGLTIQYLTFGEWFDVPAKYKLESTVVSLLSMVKSKKRRKFELLVTKSGIVSVDNDREVVLVPPE